MKGCQHYGWTLGLITFSNITMDGFEYFVLALNLAPTSSILFQFQKFKILANDPQFFKPLEQECLEKE